MNGLSGPVRGTFGMRAFAIAATVTLGCLPATVAVAAQLPSFDHIVVVVEENHQDSQIIGNPEAPYINSLAAQGALFSNSFAIEHPSQPNYLDLFSGSNQGVTDDSTPPELFTSANLGANLLAEGLTFGGYSESLPSVGFTGDDFSTVPEEGQYARKHNPWVNWQDSAANSLPGSVNMPLTDFPTDFSLLPTVSFVIPNLQNDMHDGSIAMGDAWLASNLGSYVEWAKLHNSLLILTWDEDDFLGTNQIPTLFIGANVIVGVYGEYIDHFDVLRTIEDIYELDHAGASVTASPITDVFAVPEPSTWGMVGVALGMIVLLRLRSRRQIGT